MVENHPSLAAARSDPGGFIAGLAGPVVLDEAQRAPGLFPAIKLSVDRERAPGRFLLTGSADVLTLPRLSESLAGRMEILTLWTLSQGEIVARAGSFVDVLFEGRLPGAASLVDDLAERILRGGYAEVATGKVERRDAWFASYVTAILQRDVRDLANIADLAALPRLLTLLAARPAGLLNYAALSRDSGLPQSTLKRYFALLEATFLVVTLPAWFANIGKRLVKSPKILLTDTALATHLLGLDRDRLARESTLRGGLLETFVAMELRKQIGWSRTRAAMFHFRSHSGDEVDVVLEGPGGDLVGVEVKAAATVTDSDFKGLRALASATGRRFVRGVLLHAGREAIPFGERLEALPIACLWP